jgi:hypothetical protein
MRMKKEKSVSEEEKELVFEDDNGISIDVWQKIVSTAKTQLDTSRQYKYARMKQIEENENLYLGIAEKEYKNPYDYCFPHMAGFVDTLMSEISDAPMVEFEQQGEEDYKAARVTTALFEQQTKSMLPHASWAIKDRYSKKLAIFSGVGIYKFYTQPSPFKAILTNVDHYDFHSEPAGGGDLEQHLFCGEEGIFKTKEEIEKSAEEGLYSKYWTSNLVNRTTGNDYKDNTESYTQRLNRYRGMGLDPESNNYVGQSIFKLVEWYTTYCGERYYVLFDERSMIALRVCKLVDMFSIIEPYDKPLWPYVIWHTHEDPRVFWSKAPCDDVRPISRSINKFINQELYNRDKKNMGHRLYDPKMVKDVKSLGDWRVDGLTPVDVGQNKTLSQSVHNLDVGVLNGTLEMVQFLDSWGGQKTGSTPGSQGNAPSAQKVGIFYGEMEQISKRLGVYNKSYKEAWAGIGLRFRVGIADNLEGETIPVKLLGAYGAEWPEISAEDMKSVRDFDIVVRGGDEIQMKKKEESARKAAGLKDIQTINPKWRDQQQLKALGYTDDEIKDAFSMQDPGLKELLSEAAMAEQEIVKGKNPPINRGANAAFMQHLINFAQNLSMKDKEKENEIAIKINEYARAHTSIAVDNEARSALRLITEAQEQAARARMATGMVPAGGEGAPVGPNMPVKEPVLSDAGVRGISQNITNTLMPQ